MSFHYITRVLFTILELAVALIHTFMITLIVSLYSYGAQCDPTNPRMSCRNSQPQQEDQKSRFGKWLPTKGLSSRSSTLSQASLIRLLLLGSQPQDTCCPWKLDRSAVAVGIFQYHCELASFSHCSLCRLYPHLAALGCTMQEMSDVVR